MELHLLPMFLCLILAPVVINAALPPELYWKSKLPNVTMPKAVKMLLRAGNDPSNQLLFMKRVDYGQLRNDLNSKLLIWRRHANDQFRNDPNSQLLVWRIYATNDQLRNDPNSQLLVWRIHATDDQLRDDPNRWGSHATDDQLRDNPNKQLIIWWNHDTDDQLREDPNRWGSHATNDQLRDNPNNQLITWWSHGIGDQLREDPNRWGSHATDDQLRDNPNNQLIIWWSHHTDDQLRDDPNNQLLVWRTHTTNDQLRDDPNSQLLVWSSHDTDDKLRDDPSQWFLYRNHVKDQPTKGDNTAKFLFLNENDLHPGKKLEMLFTQSPYSKALMSREVADIIPFSVEKLPEILKMFLVKPESKEAQTIKKGIHHCEMPSNVKEEEKHCVTSLESMVDYIISKLGTNVKAYSTEVEKETDEYMTYTIAPGVKKLSDDAMACHQKHYPYVLFHCHKVGNSNRVYFVPLEGSDGTRVKAVVVCHLNTADWDPKHIAFQQLGIKPGDAVCHFSPADNVVWTPNN